MILVAGKTKQHGAALQHGREAERKMIVSKGARV
jgi:hypothetical protein